MDGQIQSSMVGTGKITLNRFIDRELNNQCKNTTPEEWTDRELNGQHWKKP